MNDFSYQLPMLENKQLAFQILVGNEWTESIKNLKLHESLGDVNGENLTLYLSENRTCYGQLNLFEFDESEPDWDEGFDDERQLSPVTRFGYVFQSIEDAIDFWRHIQITWYNELTPYGFIRLTPEEKGQLIHKQSTIKIAEQYDIDGWESVQLEEGRILLTNSHRVDKAHASLFNTLADYLMDKKANEDFHDYIDQQTD